mgnify:CR=1 FL=1
MKSQPVVVKREMELVVHKTWRMLHEVSVLQRCSAVRTIAHSGACLVPAVTVRQIGSGSFGDIYSAVNKETGEQVAMKLELTKAAHPQLHSEYQVYRSLGEAVGIPDVRWCGKEGNYTVMVMDLLGRSVEDLFTRCGRRFTLKTVLMIADQALERLEAVHEAGWLHRDIKPDNFLIGMGTTRSIVHLVDFGLAKRFRDKKSGKHIAYGEGRHLTGTPRYASISNHLGIVQSRRDDMEALGFVLMYLMKGSLPWMGMKARTKKQKYEKILRKKIATPTSVLCNGYPEEFTEYFEHCRRLKFTDKPDYAMLRASFRSLASRTEIRVPYDWRFDWIVGTDTSTFEGVTRNFKKAGGTQRRASTATAATAAAADPTRPKMKKRRGKRRFDAKRKADRRARSRAGSVASQATGKNERGGGGDVDGDGDGTVTNAAVGAGAGAGAHAHAALAALGTSNHAHMPGAVASEDSQDGSGPEHRLRKRRARRHKGGRR